MSSRRRNPMRVRVFPAGPVGEPIRGYLAEVGEPLTGAQWVVFEDSRPSERTRRLAMAALVARLERRLAATLEALDAVAALGGKLPGGYEP